MTHLVDRSADGPASEHHRPRLGLVCVTASDQVRYRTVTRKRLLGYATDQERRDKLREVYSANVDRLAQAIDFCIEHHIDLYRITSDLFPFADDAMGEPLLQEYGDDLAGLGRRAEGAGIRMVMHPSQYVVLSSDSPEVVENSIKILAHHAQVLDMLQQPRTPWALIEIHGGKGERSEKLVETILGLPDAIRRRLVLENDERAYSAAQILDVCRRAGVPMVFDAHHHVCREELDSYDDPSIAEMVRLAAETWPDPSWQLVHISNGREGFRDRRHSDFIHTMPEAFASVPWIEVEAKQKEEAIARLWAEWQFFSR